MAKRLFLIVLDGLGIGAQPDAPAYADAGANSLAAVAATGKLHIPNLRELGLFNIAEAAGGEPEPEPAAAFARLIQRAGGKDGLAGHWEMAGCIADQSLPTYPDGIPVHLLDRLYGLTYRRFLCNRAMDPETVLREYSRPHLRTGHLIVYTGQDSVLQIAADETMVPVNDLLEVCRQARGLMQWEHGVGRVIARPYHAYPPDYALTANRRDFAVPPPHNTALDALRKRWMEVIGIGKVYDLFTGRGFTRTIRTKNDAEGMTQLLAVAEQHFSGLCFVNLSDFDDRALYGDAAGCAACLNAFDQSLPRLAERLGPEDMAIITADHGTDPAQRTGHTREYLPLLVFGPAIRQGVDLGTRPTMADIAATIQEHFGLPPVTAGESFLGDILLS